MWEVEVGSAEEHNGGIMETTEIEQIKKKKLDSFFISNINFCA